MSVTHSVIAQVFTDRLGPEEFHEEENSVDRGHRAEMEAMSLKRLVGRLAWWRGAKAGFDAQGELEAAVKRLSELSPHLLVDVGIDPATGEIAPEGVTLVTPRPVRSVAQVQEPEAAPAPAVRPARGERRPLTAKVLPIAGDVGKLAPG